MPPEFQPDVWPWEWLWAVAILVATVVLLSLVVRRIRKTRLRSRAPWLRYGLLAIAIVLIAMPFFFYDDWPDQLWRSQNISETSAQSADPDLRTRVYPLSAEFMFAEVVRVLQDTPSWRLTRQDAKAGLISAEVSVALGFFTNDVLIQVTVISAGGTQVDVRASARRPEGDLGSTEREIGVFYRRLDRAINNPSR